MRQKASLKMVATRKTEVRQFSHQIASFTKIISSNTAISSNLHIRTVQKALLLCKKKEHYRNNYSLLQSY